MIMVLSSCLNDLEDFTGQFSGSPVIAEIPEASNAATGTVSREIIDPTKPAEFTLRVNIASPFPLDKDTKITLALDNNLITLYNAEKGYTGSAAAIPVPLDALTVTSYEVVVPAGKREAEWTFKIDANKLPNSLAIKYLLPVKIESAENNVVVSGNFGTKLVRVLARNKWDGIYTATGTLTDLSTSAITGNYPMTISLVTASSFTCTVEEPAASAYGSPPIFHSIKSGGSFSVYGSYGMVVTFDASDKVVSLINYYGQPASNGRSGALDPLGINTYNPSTKIVTIKYWMIQPSVVASGPRTIFDEVWTYVGPR